MNCEESLLAQAEATHALNPAAHQFVYRNAIKALPWFTLVREKLADKQYWGWFLPYANCTHYECGPDATHNLYHDFECVCHCQAPTPATPSCTRQLAASHLTPSFHPLSSLPCCACRQTPRGDCGAGIECGEYLYDLRNASLRAWLASDYLLGPTGLGSPAIHGFYFGEQRA